MLIKMNHASATDNNIMSSTKDGLTRLSRALPPLVRILTVARVFAHTRATNRVHRGRACVHFGGPADGTLSDYGSSWCVDSRSS